MIKQKYLLERKLERLKSILENKINLQLEFWI